MAGQRYTFVSNAFGWLTYHLYFFLQAWMAVDGRALAMRWSAQVLRSAWSVRWTRNKPGLSGRPRFRANASVELAWLLRSDASEGLRNGRIWGARSVAREFVHIAFLVHVGLRVRAEGPNLFPTPIDPRSLAFTSLYMNSRIGGAEFQAFFATPSTRRGGQQL